MSDRPKRKRTTNTDIMETNQIDGQIQVWNEDCIPGLSERIAPQSVDLCVTSIPFGAL